MITVHTIHYYTTFITRYYYTSNTTQNIIKIHLKIMKDHVMLHLNHVMTSHHQIL